MAKTAPKCKTARGMYPAPTWQENNKQTNKQTGTAGEHYRDEGNHLSIDEEDLLHLDEDEASVAFSWTGSLANVQGISTVLIHKRFCTLASPAMWMPRVLFSLSLAYFFSDSAISRAYKYHPWDAHLLYWKHKHFKEEH